MMPDCSHTPSPNRRLHGRQQGFSLLEIMAVVVIIGIILSLTTISIGTVDDDGVGEHARRFEALIDLALEDASMQGRELGLQFYQHGYEFAVREIGSDEDGNPIWIWTPLENDQLLKARDFGDDVTVDLELEGEEVTLLYERDTDEEYIPQIFLMSSGDVQPEFAVRLRRTFSSDGTVLAVNALGEFDVSYDND